MYARRQTFLENFWMAVKSLFLITKFDLIYDGDVNRLSVSRVCTRQTEVMAVVHDATFPIDMSMAFSSQRFTGGRKSSFNF